MEEKQNNTYENWKVTNPNGNLNEFYIHLRNTNSLNYTPINNINSITNQYYLKKETQNFISVIVGCIACVLGLIGFFTPWFSLPIFKISISGNEMSQLSNLLGNYIKNQNNIQNINLIKFTYIIPITYILIFLGSIIKSYFLTILVSIINLVSVGIIVGFLFYNIPQAFSIISYGIYITILTWFVILYNAFTLKF